MALTSAHKAENAELAKRANATHTLVGKVDELGSKLGKLLGMKDPIGKAMTGSILDPSAWTARL